MTMPLRAVIFDLDGTLIDSMEFWQNLALSFLRRHGVSDAPRVMREIALMTLGEALAYALKECSIPLMLPQAIAEIEADIASFYGERARFKPGAAQFLAEVRRRGLIAGILSNTPRDHVEKALIRFGVRDIFSVIRHAGDPGMSKHRPEGFLRMAELLDAAPAETLVCEDALYAAVSAKEAGFRVCAIRDDSEPQRAELARVADLYLDDWGEFPLSALD